MFHSLKPLTWGVANVERSMTGGFFMFLRRPSSSSRPRTARTTRLSTVVSCSNTDGVQSAAEFLVVFHTPLDFVAYHDMGGQAHNNASGHQRTKHKHFKERCASGYAQCSGPDRRDLPVRCLCLPS